MRGANASPWSDIIAKYIYGNVSHRVVTNYFILFHSTVAYLAYNLGRAGPISKQCLPRVRTTKNYRLCGFIDLQCRRAVSSPFISVLFEFGLQFQRWMNLEPKTSANNSSSSSSNCNLSGSKKRKHSSSASKKSGSKHQCCCKRYKKANGKSIHQHYKPKPAAPAPGGLLMKSDKTNQNEPIKYQQSVAVQCLTNGGASGGGGISWSHNDTNCSNSEFDAGFFEGATFASC